MSQSPRETPEDEEAPTAPSPNEDDPQQQQQHAAGAEGMNQDDSGEPTAGYEFEVKEQDRWLPIANVARIMKNALPDNAKIAKEAKECMQECVSEFISFITSEASEKCQQEKRKTVNGEDILFAMTSLGFENYGEALKIYLARYRETLVARGETTQKPPGAPGAAASAGAAAQSGAAPAGSYENSHNVMAHPIDPSAADGGNNFYADPGAADY